MKTDFLFLVEKFLYFHSYIVSYSHSVLCAVNIESESAEWSPKCLLGIFFPEGNKFSLFSITKIDAMRIYYMQVHSE